MKVTVVAPLPPIKAISPYCYRLVQALNDRIDFECITFSRTSPEGLYADGTRDSTLQPPNLPYLNQEIAINVQDPFSWFHAGLKAKGDLVHLQHWKISTTLAYCFILPLLKIRGKKILLSVHNITPHAPEKIAIVLTRILDTFVFQFADGFIIHNERNKKRFEELFGPQEKPVFIIPVGLHMPMIDNPVTRKEARKRLKIPEGKKVLLSFGYIWKYKGIEVLLNALEPISKEVPEVLLIIAGSVITGWDRCESVIQKKHLEDYVQRHLSYVPEPEAQMYFAAADLVVLPYVPPFDTHGGVGAMAVALHKPLLVSDIGGLPEYIRDQRACVQPGDVDELAGKVICILQDPRLRVSLASDSRAVAKEISWDIIARKTIQAYEQILGEPLLRPQP